MKSKHICPKCGCKTFITTAHVMQDWVANEDGDYLATFDDCVQVDTEPDDDNIWTCNMCGAEAVINKE